MRGDGQRDIGDTQLAVGRCLRKFVGLDLVEAVCAGREEPELTGAGVGIVVEDRPVGGSFVPAGDPVPDAFFRVRGKVVNGGWGAGDARLCDEAPAVVKVYDDTVDAGMCRSVESLIRN
jgi:hypothetical protein